MAKINIDLGFNIDSKNLNRSIGDIQKKLKQLSDSGSLDGLKLNPKELQAYQKQLVQVYNQAVKLRDQSNYGVASGSSWKDVQREVSQFNDLNREMGVSAKLAQTATMEQAKLTEGIKTTKTSLAESLSITDKLSDNFKKIASWSISAVAFREVAKQLRASVGYAAELDASLNAIRTVTGKGFEESQRMAVAYNQMARDLSSTTKEIADASVEFYRQGRTDSEVNKLVEATKKASAVSNEDMTNTTSMLTASLNGFQLAADAAEGVIDKFAALDAASATSFKEMSYALTKVASAAHNAEISIDQTLGMIATVSSVTREAPENIGTSFKTIFARMRGTTDDGFIDDSSIQILNKVDEALGSIGIRQREWNGDMKSSFSVLNELGGQWGDLNKQTQAYLATQIAGSRQQSRFFAMMDNWDMVSASIETAEQSAGKANEQFSRYQQGVEASAKKTEAMLESLRNMAFDPSSLIAVNKTVQVFLGSLEMVFTHLRPMTIAINLLSRAIGGKLFDSVRKISGPLEALGYKMEISKPGSKMTTWVSKLGSVASKTSGEITTLEGKIAELYKNRTEPKFKGLNHIMGGISAKEVNVGGKNMTELENLVTNYKISDKEKELLGKNRGVEYDEDIKALEGYKQQLLQVLDLEQDRIKFKKTLTDVENDYLKKYGQEPSLREVDEELLSMKNKHDIMLGNISELSEKEEEYRSKIALNGKLSVEEANEYDKIRSKRATLQTQEKDHSEKIRQYEAANVDLLSRSVPLKASIVEKARALGIVNIHDRMTMEEILDVIEEQNAALKSQAALLREQVLETSNKAASHRAEAQNVMLIQEKWKGVAQTIGAVTNLMVGLSRATTKYDKSTAIAQATGSVASSALGIAGMATFGPIGAMLGQVAGQAIGAGMQAAAEKARKEAEALEKRIEEYTSFIDSHRNDKKTLREFEDFDYLRGKVGDLNENLGLTNERYNEFLRQNAEVAKMFPEMIQGHDQEGNAIMRTSFALKDYNDELERVRLEQGAIYAQDFPGIMERNAEKIEELKKESTYKSAQKDVTKYTNKLAGSGLDQTDISEFKSKLTIAQNVIKTYDKQMKEINSESERGAQAILMFAEGFEDLQEESVIFVNSMYSNLGVLEVFSHNSEQIQLITDSLGRSFAENEDGVMRLKSSMEDLNKSYAEGLIGKEAYEEAQFKLLNSMMDLLGITGEMLKENPALYDAFAKNTSIVGSLSIKNEKLATTYNQIMSSSGLAQSEIQSLSDSIEKMGFKEFEGIVELMERLNMSEFKGVKELATIIPKLSTSGKKMMKDISIEPKSNAELQKLLDNFEKLYQLESRNLPIAELRELEAALYAVRLSSDFQYNLGETSDYSGHLNELIVRAKDTVGETTKMVDVLMSSLSARGNDSSQTLAEQLDALSQSNQLIGSMTLENGKMIFDSEKILNLIQQKGAEYKILSGTISQVADESERAARTGAEMYGIMDNARKMGLSSKDSILKEIQTMGSEIFSGLSEDTDQFFNDMNSRELNDKVVSIIAQISVQSPAQLAVERARMEAEHRKALDFQSGANEMSKISQHDIVLDDLNKKKSDLEKKQRQEEKQSKAYEKSLKGLEKQTKKLAKSEEDLIKKRKELDQTAILNKNIHKWNIAERSVEKYNQELEYTKLLMDDLSEFDFSERETHLLSNIEQMVEKDIELKKLFNEFSQYEPVDEKDAKEVSDRISKIGDEMISNMREVRELQKEVDKNHIASITGQSDYNDSKLSDWDTINDSNKTQLTEGFASGTGHQLALSYKRDHDESPLEKKKKENEALIEEERKYREEIRKIVERSADIVRQKQLEDYEEAKVQMAEQKEDLKQQRIDLAEQREDLKALMSDPSLPGTAESLKSIAEQITVINKAIQDAENAKSNSLLSTFFDFEVGKFKAALNGMDEGLRKVLESDILLRELMEGVIVEISKDAENLNFLDQEFINSFGLLVTQDEWVDNIAGIAKSLRDEVGDKEEMASAVLASLKYASNQIEFSTFKEAIDNMNDAALDNLKAFIAGETNEGVRAELEEITKQNPLEINPEFDKDLLYSQIADAIKGARKDGLLTVQFDSNLGEITTEATKARDRSAGEGVSQASTMMKEQKISTKNTGGHYLTADGKFIKHVNRAAPKEVSYANLPDKAKEKFIKMIHKELPKSKGVTIEMIRSAFENDDFTAVNQQLRAYASGVDSAPGGPALVGEEAQELAIYPDGTQRLLGKNGPELVNLPQGAKIYDAKDTKTILKHTGKGVDGKKLQSYAEGTTKLKTDYRGDQLITAISLLLTQDKLMREMQYKTNDSLDRLIEVQLKTLVGQEEGGLSVELQRFREGMLQFLEEKDSVEFELTGNQEEIDKDALALGIVPNSKLIAETEMALNIVYDENKSKLETPFVISPEPDMLAIKETDQSFVDLFENLVRMTDATAIQISTIVSAVVTNMEEMARASARSIQETARALQDSLSAMGGYSGTTSTAPLSGKSVTIGGSKINKQVYDWIMKASDEVGLEPASLFALVQKESSFQPKGGYSDGSGGRMSYGYTALNSGGALPEIMKDLDRRGYDAEKAKTDSYENILGGAIHLQKLMKKYGEKEGFRRYNGSGPMAARYANDAMKKQAIFMDSLRGFAKGVRSIHEDTNAIVGEEGPELIQYPDGTKELRGQNGPEMMVLPKGSSVVTANETRAYLKENDVGESENIRQQLASVEAPSKVGQDTVSKGTKRGASDVAKEYIGKVKYTWGASNIDAGKADCSGFVSSVLNKTLPGGFGRTDTRGLAKIGTGVDHQNIQKDDILVFKNTTKAGGISHAGIALGNNQMIHLGNAKDNVKVVGLNNYWTSRLAAVRRVSGAGGDPNGTNLDGLDQLPGLGNDYISSRDQANAEAHQANMMDREIITEEEYKSVSDLVSTFYQYKKGTEAFKTMLSNVRMANKIPPFHPVSKGTKVVLPKIPQGSNFVNAFETGGQVNRDQYALYGESGYELGIFPDGRQELLGRDGPEVGFLPKGTLVVNHENTKKIISENKQGFVQGYESKGQKLSLGDDKVAKESTETLEENTETTKTLTNQMSKAFSSIDKLQETTRAGIEQRNFIENEIFNNPARRGQSAEWELIKEQISILEEIAQEQGLAGLEELLTGTTMTSDGLIINNRESLVDQGLIDLVTLYEKSINNFVKKFGFEASQLTGAVITAGEKLDKLTKKYTMTEKERALREDYNKRARDYNETTKKILGYDKSGDYINPRDYTRPEDHGVNQYIDASEQMSEKDFKSYLDNKRVYSQLVGDKGYAKALETLSENEKKRLKVAMETNKALRERYGIEKDLVGLKEMERGHSIINAEGVDQFLSMHRQMDEADFKSYVANKELYASLVGSGSLSEAYKTLSAADKDRVEAAMKANESLRIQYGIQKDIANLKDIEAGQRILQNLRGNPLSDKKYQEDQVEALRVEDFKMLYYNLLSDEVRLRDQLALYTSEYENLLAAARAGLDVHDKLAEQEEKIANTMDKLTNNLSDAYQALKQFTYGDDLEKFEKRMDKVRKQASNYSQIRQEDLINVMQYMKQELQYTEGSVAMWETVISAQEDLIRTLEVGSKQWKEANKDLEEYKESLEEVAHAIEMQKRALMEQSFNVFEKVLERIQKRIESINKIDDIKELTASFHDLQLELNSINGIIDYSAMGTEGDLAMVQGMLDGLVNSEGQMINAVESIDELKKKIANMPKETDADRELIAATIMQATGMTEAQLEQLAKHQSYIKKEIREVTAEYNAQTKAYDDLVKLKEEEIEELNKKNKEESKYNDLIKLRMQLLRALDETEHRYITGRGTVEYRADLDKVNDIKAQINEKTGQDRKDREQTRLEEEIKELREEQAEKARVYDLQIATLQASLAQSEKTSEIMSEMKTFLTDWPDYVYGMTDIELKRLEESITGFQSGVLEFDSFNLQAFGANGYLEQTLDLFLVNTEKTFEFFDETVRETMERTGESLSEVLKGTGESIYEAIQTEHEARMADNNKLFDRASSFFDQMIAKINDQVQIAKNENKGFADGLADKIVKTPATPPPVQSSPSTPNHPASPGTSAQGAGTHHIVAKGDNLWNIVKGHYGLTNNSAIAKRINQVVDANPNLPHLQTDVEKDGIKGDRPRIGDKLFLPRFNTGGYTGDWTGDQGKLAVLDKKELILNARDTEKFLEGIRLQRDLQVREDRMTPLFSALFANLNKQPKDTEAMRPIIIENIELPDVTDAPAFVSDLSAFLSHVERNQG